MQPDDAVSLFLKQVPEAALAANAVKLTRTGLGIFAMTMVADPAKQHGIGDSDPADYAAMTDLVAKYTGAPEDKKLDPSSQFTNDFAGAVTLTPTEWAKAEENVSEYRAYFA